MRQVMKVAVLLGAQYLSAECMDVHHSSCPTLSSASLGFYLCPHLGSKNVVPQDMGVGMVYQRPSQSGVMAGIANLCSAVSKGTRSDGKSYQGVESNPQSGKIVCKYKLPGEWVKEGGDSHFSLSADIHSPTDINKSLCPPLTYDQMNEARCQTTYQMKGGPQWAVHTEGAKDALSQFCKGALQGLKSVVKDSPKGKAHGDIDPTSKPFTHTCTYDYHSGSSPMTLVLNGAMDLRILTEVQTLHNRG